MKTAMGFFGRGNWISKFLTVIMTAVSLALFAIGSMGYTYDEMSYLTDSYRRFLERESYLVFCKNQTGTLGNEFSALIKEETAVEYFSAVSSEFIFLQNFIFECNHFNTFSNDSDSRSINDYINLIGNSPEVAGSNELMDEMGFDMIEGVRPLAADETMISLDVFEAFRAGGYADRTGENLTKTEIVTYSDIIGKKLSANIGNAKAEFTITGVFDNTKAKERDQNWEYSYPQNSIGNAKLVFAECFLEEWVYVEGGVSVKYLFAPVKEELLTDRKIRSYIKISEELLKKCEEELKSPGVEDFDLYRFRNYIGAVGYSNSLGHYTSTSAGGMWLVDYYVLILSSLGGVLLLMAVIFNSYLITDSLYSAREQIGVLRSLGYRKAKIARMILLSALILALLTFLFALIVTVSVYYGWFRGFVTRGDGVLFEFSIWTVLILLSASVAVPLLSAIVPILLFFKRPIVENIKARE